MNRGVNDRRRIALAVLVAVLSVVVIAVVAGALGVVVSNTFGVDREATSIVSLVVSGVASGAIAAALVRRFRARPKASDADARLRPSGASEKVSGSPETT